MSEPHTEAPYPSQSELIIGLVAAVGIDADAIYLSLARVMTRFGYECHDLHLSEQLRELDWNQRLDEAPEDERISSHMTAGNRLRELWGRDDAFALLAINAITFARSEHGSGREDPLDRHAYVLRTLKRREEAELLREVYGSRFVQVSVYAPKEARIAALRDRIVDSRVLPADPTPAHTAEELVARDAGEAAEHGQNVRGIFHEGDVFIDAMLDVDEQLGRTIEILFGHPNRTPNKDETGMFHAVAAMRRSAELGRQVGAAICTAEGSIVAVGANEVPRAGGGMYWEGDPGDAREFTLGRDTNDARKAHLAERVADLLVEEGLIAHDDKRGDVVKVIATSELDDLIEFVRAVHAEMAAVTDAVRRGVGIAGTCMYVTTFPCHHCGRHLVAAGVARVVYIAPYPKSLAEELHGDAICVDPSNDDAREGKVTFEPFVGIGPRRFLDLFAMPQRKNRKTGTALAFDPRAAMPRLDEIEPIDMLPEILPYIRREQRALVLMARVIEDRGPGFR